MQTSPFRSFVSAALFLTVMAPVHQLPGEESTGSATILEATGDTDVDEDGKTIPWSHLAPENGKPFSDSFAKLTQNQLSNLSYVVRVRRLITEEKIEADGVDAKEAAKLARKLTNDGIDIDWLMAQRKHVQQMRGLQVENVSRSIANSLSETKVTLIGYVVPIKVTRQRLTEFFLVPTSAACSNEAAPSPLKVLFISTKQGIARSDRKLPVRVTGTVRAQTTEKAVRNGIPVTTIQSAYTMLYPTIEVYTQPGKSRHHRISKF